MVTYSWLGYLHVHVLMYSRHLNDPLTCLVAYKAPKSPSIFLAEPQWSSLPHMIAILLLLFPFQPFCSAWSLALMMCMFLPVIFLATCAMLPLLYSVCTFQFLIFLIFLGCIGCLCSSVVSCCL